MFSRLATKNKPSMNMHEQVYFVLLLNDLFFSSWHRIHGLFQHLSPTLTLTRYAKIQFWHHLPGVNISSHKLKCSVPQDCSHFRCQLQISSHLYFWLTSCKLGRPLLRFNNLLEWLTELRKAIYLCLLVYCKVYKWIARWGGI